MHYKAIKTKLKLNNCQSTLMAKHAGFSRWVYNWGLRLWSEGYIEGLKPSANALKKVFTNYVKPQFYWMSELSSRVYQYAFLNLGDAFKRFFKKLEGYPNFKRKGVHDSFTIDNCGKPIKVGGLRHKLPFIGWVKTHEPLPEFITKKVTISRQAGDWYLSFHVEVLDLAPTPKSVDVVGVDLGINSLATLSTGVVFPNLKPYRQAKQKLARLQRSVSRKLKGSANRRLAVLKLARQHRVYDCLNCGLSIDRDLNAAINLCNWGRLAPRSLPRVNRSHAPYEAESKPHCLDKSCNVLVL